MSRRLLQLVTGLMGLATVGIGAVQVLFGVDSPVYASTQLPASPVLDSNLRFFGGMGVGLGAILVAIVPNIEHRALLFRAVWGCAFLGGVGRLISLFAIGRPSNLLLVFTVLEVVGAPLLVYWHHRLVRASAVVSGSAGGSHPS